MKLQEFFKRWGEGIANITPLQQTHSQILFTKITLLGLFLGFIVCLSNIKNLWWLAIILGAAFGNTIVGLIALWQKEKILKSMEVQLNSNEEVKHE